MSLQIMINGQPFTEWESAMIQRSIDSNSGAFQFTNSSEAPIDSYPVKAGDFVEIIISGIRKIAGFVDDVPDVIEDGTHTISVIGRDSIQDLIDSSVPESARVTEGPVSLEKLCQNVISALGAKIKVINKATGIEDFTDEDLQSSGAGEQCMSYLVKFARKRQVYLVPDGDSNLVIYRPDPTNKASSPLLLKKNNLTNNILSRTKSNSQQNRFNKYLCRSQDNFGFSMGADYEEDGTDRKDEAIDSQIRASRYIEFQGEESMTDTECLERAKEEVNIRRAKSQEYIVTVAGVTQSNGTVWDFGQFVNVQDDYADVSGEFLISAVEYSQDINKGTITTLTISPPDAYQVKADPTKESARSAKSGDAYQNKTPIEQGQTTR